MEVLDESSTVQTSEQQFVVNPVFLDIAAILRSNQTHTFINTKGKVSRIKDCQLVGTPPDMKFRRQVYLTSATGSLVIVFWRQLASTLIFEEGDVLSMKNLQISTWNGKVTGNLTVETELTIIDEEIKDTQAVLPKPSNIVSTTTDSGNKRFHCHNQM